jgi:hypothetical protein
LTSAKRRSTRTRLPSPGAADIERVSRVTPRAVVIEQLASVVRYVRCNIRARAGSETRVPDRRCAVGPWMSCACAGDGSGVVRALRQWRKGGIGRTRGFDRGVQRAGCLAATLCLAPIGARPRPAWVCRGTTRRCRGLQRSAYLSRAGRTWTRRMARPSRSFTQSTIWSSGFTQGDTIRISSVRNSESSGNGEPSTKLSLVDESPIFDAVGRAADV